MPIELAGFLRTTLPLDLSRLAGLDGGRYGAAWMPDHLVSSWPDATWTPDFTTMLLGPDPGSGAVERHRHTQLAVWDGRYPAAG
jgi:phthiodiolone/phenolphthiodiolone dimycocerosates ketoreductase